MIGAGLMAKAKAQKLVVRAEKITDAHPWILKRECLPFELEGTPEEIRDLCIACTPEKHETCGDWCNGACALHLPAITDERAEIQGERVP